MQEEKKEGRNCQYNKLMEKRYRYSRGNRINKKNQYQDVFTKGKRTTGMFVRLYINHAEQDQANKVGIVISKKIKGSVKRNRYKRLLREYFRVNQHEFGSGKNIVAYVMKEILPDSFETVEKEITRLMAKR